MAQYAAGRSARRRSCRHPQKELTINRRTATLVAALILLVAAFLRLGAFQEALVGADQSSILASAADIAALRDFPLVGMKSSVGVMQTAAVAYLAALPLFLVHRVIAIRWFFSIIDLLALAFLYRAVGRTFGRRPGLIAALLVATSPWLIEFNRWIWYQTLISTFAIVAFSALLLALRSHAGGRSGLIAIAMVGATLMGLVHLASLPWAAVLWMLALVTVWQRRWWVAAAVGALVSLAIAAPYASFLVRSHFVDVATILADGASEGSTWNWSTYRLTLELLTGQQVLETPHNPLWSQSVLHADALMTVVPVLLIAAAAAALWQIATEKRYRRTTVFVLAWTVLAPTLFVRSGVHLQHFYLLFVFPAPYVLIAVALGRGLKKPLGQARVCPGRKPHRSRPVWASSVRSILSLVALGSVLLLSAWWTSLWIVRIGYEQHGELRASTRAWLMDEAVTSISDLLAADPARQVIILTHFGTGELSPFDWVRNFIGSDRVRVVPVETGLVVPPAETCYLIAERASIDALDPVAMRLTPRPDLAIPASPPWPFYCVPPRPPLTEPLASWQNGLSLLQSDVSGDLVPGGHLDIVYTWHYRALQNHEYHFFTHLMLDGTLVAQIDGAGIPTRYWRDDDVFVTRFTLALPADLQPGAYGLTVGAYTWPDVVRVPLDGARDSYDLAHWDLP